MFADVTKSKSNILADVKKKTKMIGTLSRNKMVLFRTPLLRKNARNTEPRHDVVLFKTRFSLEKITARNAGPKHNGLKYTPSHFLWGKRHWLESIPTSWRASGAETQGSSLPLSAATRRHYVT